MKREAKRIRRTLSADELARVAATRKWAADNESAIKSLAQLYQAEAASACADLGDVVALLKAERLRQQLSLADIHQRVGIDRPNLCRLENEAEANPTVATLLRYAQALGKKLQVVLADAPAADSAGGG